MRRGSINKVEKRCVIAGCNASRHPGKNYCLPHYKETSEYDKTPGGFGLDAELAAKAAAKYDTTMERAVQTWIENVVGEQFPGGFAESLKDGVFLCKLINVIQPGTVRRINNSRMPFKQMENITAFLKGCRALGMHEYDLFTTVALFEEKDMGSVVLGLSSLGRKAQSVPGFSGPYLGPKEATKNVRTFNEAQLRKADTGMTRMAQGSSATMARTGIDRSRDITYGRDAAGASVGGNSVSKLSSGSAGVMQRTAIDRSRDITYGRDNAGVGTTGISTRQNQGSYGVMERSAVDRTRDITFGASADTKAVPPPIPSRPPPVPSRPSAAPVKKNKFCSECGNPNPGKFCSECGTKQ
jgi:hypothetical protein